MSRITSVEVVEYEHHVPIGFDAAGRRLAVPTTRTQRRFVVSITDSSGAVGSYAPLWSAPPFGVTVTKALARSLVGMSSDDRELVWDRANESFAKTDRIGAGAIDIALWDLAGRRAGMSVSAMLGRYRTRLPAYASTLSGGGGLGTLSSPETYAEFARECRELGFPGFKLHGPVNAGLREEIAALRASADGAAGEMHVMTDPGNGLPTLAQALELGRACDDVGAFWLEDPMRADAPFAHRILRERIRTPVLITEFVRGLDQRMAVALGGGSDFLRADPELDMGITGVMKTAHAAESIGLDLEVHASGPAQRHCMAAIRNTNYYELGLLDPTSGNPLHPPVYAGDYVEDASAVGEDGCVAVPEGPGLGIEYDWAYLRAHQVDRVLVD
ncbi:Mandelate racemase/muconate lactonizing protein [Beutenbergia cavernae DSM 12333]|uniref:glucarate dehydratase n=1 Tax=Beutenbergia cavernae (strain ATCC BAA-8 / DSM 12333 / CCUG 43141 / JCM 11478 / NBRC 16432 / NCIMB 13614 / HKI 0122) TaxID=471853 RepID=C5C2V1_BEUC1|nr:enolase C-terminal domain-like protein [Beutenbergia cavernae]ACQ81795.1 Mandelate racemase/muconate lactonizing protein [Beutenbergia cavernae DSM 12333]